MRKAESDFTVQAKTGHLRALVIFMYLTPAPQDASDVVCARVQENMAVDDKKVVFEKLFKACKCCGSDVIRVDFKYNTDNNNDNCSESDNDMDHTHNRNDGSSANGAHDAYIACNTSTTKNEKYKECNKYQDRSFL
eukprot:6484950-Amphidinium_carterae.1